MVYIYMIHTTARHIPQLGIQLIQFLIIDTDRKSYLAFAQKV